LTPLFLLWDALRKKNHKMTTKPAQRSSKPTKTQAYVDIFVARSDGVEYSTSDIDAKIRGQGLLSEPLDESSEHLRAWEIKLGKTIKFNLGTQPDDSKWAR
jgi:hypothetical protein